MRFIRHRISYRDFRQWMASVLRPVCRTGLAGWWKSAGGEQDQATSGVLNGCRRHTAAARPRSSIRWLRGITPR